MTESRIAARKQRWRNLYEGSDRYALLLQVNGGAAAPWPNPDRAAELVEWAWSLYETQAARVALIDDDTIPYLRVFTGTEIFAEAFGCPVHRPEDNMPFALPCVHDASAAEALPIPDLDCRPLARLFDIADELRRRSGPEAPVRLVDVQSPMDIAALIWEKGSFYRALLETPEAVKVLSGKVTRLLEVFLDEWFGRYGREFIAHYPDYWMPAGVTVSEDEIGSVDPETFAAFFLPELEELSERYGGIGIHCCANARHHWPGLARVPNLRLINLAQPPDVLREAYRFFAPHAAQMHSWCGDGDPADWPRGYPADARVVIQASADSVDEAARLADTLRAACAASA